MVYADAVAPALASGSFYAQRPFYLSPDKLESDYAPVRFERELRIFRSYCRAGRVLDVGCSTGAFLYQLRALYPGDYSVVGTDVAGAPLDHAENRGLEVIREPFLEFDFGQTRFDAITFWAVMEHLILPRQFLRHAASLLKAGGLCFVLVPNLRSLAVRLLGPKYRYIMPDHVNYFSSITLKALASSEPSFELLALRSTHFNPVVLWQDFLAPKQAVTDLERARLLKRTTGYKMNRFLKPAKWLYDGVERMLGRMRLADNLVVVLRRA
jgi:SAM-dependent methyltransferase